MYLKIKVASTCFEVNSTKLHPLMRSSFSLRERVRVRVREKQCARRNNLLFSPMPQFFQQYWLDILTRASEHLWLSLLAVVGAVVIGVPLGVLIARNAKWQSPVLGFANIVQTVPSLALFGFLLPILGLGTGNALAALLLYSLLPIIRNTFTGLTGVDPNVREAARAMGMTQSQMLRRVEMPLAADVILAGIRTATVLCIGITTIASFIGAGGLGDLIQNGLRTNDNSITLAGAIPAALLALGADWMLGSWQKTMASRREGVVKSTTFARIGLASGAVIFALLLVAPQLVNAFTPAKRGAPIVSGPPITVAAKEFSESRILAEILIIAAREQGIDARRGPDLGGNLAHQAILNGKIDAYPEYTGTAYTELLGNKPISDTKRVYDQAKAEYASKFKLTISPPLGFSNGFAMLIRGKDAQKLGIETLSQAVPYAHDWKAGFGPDFISRADGWPGLSRTYGLQLAAPPRSLDLGLLNRALASGQVDLIAGNETDGTIPSLGLFQLRDDKNYFPPYQGIYIVRDEAMNKQPKLRAVLDELADSISTAEMQKLNYQVDGEKKRPADVARAWWDGR